MRARVTIVTILFLLSCSAGLSACKKAQPDSRSNLQAMNQIAQSYVKLALAVGEHDEAYIDAYYGPEEWRTQVKQEKKPLATVKQEATPLIAELDKLDAGREEEIVQLRHQYLRKQLQAMIGRIDMLEGKRLSFDEESKALYDSVAPTNSESHFQAILNDLEKRLPGAGPLVERYDNFRKAFVIPKDKLDTVFRAAIEEARKRTRRHIELPENESFVLEYVTDKSWSGYNWYKGNSHSLIQINTDLPIYIDRAIDLASHEGYPGHHVYNVLLEQRLVKEREWIEFTVYPLFSPQSLIAEGTANYGIDVAFPEQERIEFEQTVLFPLAGLDPATTEAYYEVGKLVANLNYAGNEAARRYLNAEINQDQAIDWLTRFALMPADRARQRLRFIEQYRSYVINYNLGKDLVKNYIESKGGTADQPQRRWDEFEKLISSPRLPSGLKTE